MTQRIGTETEKRDIFFRSVLDDHLNGETHALTRLLAVERIPIAMEEADQEALLDRMMRTPLQSGVLDLLNDLVLKTTLTSLLSAAQEKLQKASQPVLYVSFKHYPAPLPEDGGWARCTDTNPRMKPWAKIFKKYGGEEGTIIGSSRNMENLRQAYTHNLPLDVLITHGADEGAPKAEDRKKMLMRFIIFEPFPDDQKGFCIYVKDTPTATKK